MTEPSNDHSHGTAPQTQLPPPEKAPARYAVDVQHYAQYDKDTDSGYTPELQKSLNYAARTPFTRFFLDFLLILTRPGAFWKGQDEHPATLGQLHFPHLFILVTLRTLMAFLGGILQPEPVFSRALIQAATQALLIFVMIWVLALIISGISTLTGQRIHYDRALRYVGYSITPNLFVGIISIVPVPYLATICDFLAMPWTFLVMGAGVHAYLKIKPEIAPTLTGLYCGMMLCMWTALPMLIPTLLQFNIW
ncbi:MAG: YIP1 family protein [Proteobacteria bacterium]|nr:YIP1 family protein [Pseudomonadota bacterium]